MEPTVTRIVPNDLQGGRCESVLVTGQAPRALTRLGAAKVEFLIDGVAQLRARARVLELFGGTGLSTALIAKRLARPQRLVSIDLHYGAGAWRYCVAENYRQHSALVKVKQAELPLFVAADAARLPLADGMFDCVIAPDSPRTRFDASGIESSLSDDQQRALFLAAAVESLRVLGTGGTFAATAPRSWCMQLRGAKIITGPSPRLRFKDSDDPVVYVRCRRD